MPAEIKMAEVSDMRTKTTQASLCHYDCFDIELTVTIINQLLNQKKKNRLLIRIFHWPFSLGWPLTSPTHTSGGRASEERCGVCLYTLWFSHTWKCVWFHLTCPQKAIPNRRASARPPLWESVWTKTRVSTPHSCSSQKFVSTWLSSPFKVWKLHAPVTSLGRRRGMMHVQECPVSGIMVRELVRNDELH